MIIENQINQLIDNINKIKPLLGNDAEDFRRKFGEILDSSIEETELLLTSTPNENKKSAIPDWVDPDYGYDPNNPRKPNMREMIESISKSNLEDMLVSSDASLLETTALQASEMLYGVIGSNQDTRDWSQLKSTGNLVDEVRRQTSLMYEPKVKIVSIDDGGSGSINQKAILTDKDGQVLRNLDGSQADIEQTLLNFGATKESIPVDLAEQTKNSTIDNEIIDFLANYNGNDGAIRHLLAKTASEAISSKIVTSSNIFMDLEDL